MGREATQMTGRVEQATIAALVAAALLAFGALVLAPRSHEPVVLVPLGNSAAKALPALIASPDTLLLARGSLPGSYIVRGRRPGFIAGLTGHGVLVLNSAAPGCGPANAQSGS